MAERRMFTKIVTEDDNFVALSSSAQALYLHLSMSADDDGFCNQVSVAMFRSHASVQDLEALLKKRFIYQYQNGVIVIKHWRMANALRKDRYTPTKFKEELQELKLDENGAYTWLPNGCQMVATCLPQDRLGKDSIGKNNIVSKDTPVQKEEQKNVKHDELFDKFWKAYPKKVSKEVARKSFEKLKVDDELLNKMLTAIENQKQTKQWQEANGQYIPMASTWLNQHRWEDELEINLFSNEQPVQTHYSKETQEIIDTFDRSKFEEF